MALIQMNSVDEAILALIVSVALSLALLGKMCVHGHGSRMHGRMT